jgi:hypothetical protein
MIGPFVVIGGSLGRADDTALLCLRKERLLAGLYLVACLIFFHIDLLVWADLESSIVDLLSFLTAASLYFLFVVFGSLSLHMTRRYHLWILIECLRHGWYLVQKGISFGLALDT